MTPFNPFPVPALGFPMLLISLSFLCSCNMWCVHVSVWFQNDIQNLDYWLNVVLPWTNSAFPYLRPHLLDRWGGGRGASTPADVLFLIILLWHSFGSREGDNKSIFFVLSSLYDNVSVPVLITAVGSPFAAVEFTLNLKLLSSYSFLILQSVRDHWETSRHYNLLWILLIHLCWLAWIFLSCTLPLLLLGLERFSWKSCAVQLNMYLTFHNFHG